MTNIDFPFNFDGTGRTAQPDDRAAHVRNMIEQFLFTNPGERVNRPDFGSGLRNLLFEPSSPQLAEVLRNSIQVGLARWLGDVITVSAVQVDASEGVLRVTIQYALRRTGEVHTEMFERSAAS